VLYVHQGRASRRVATAFEQLFQESGVGDVGEVFLAELLALAVEFVREALQKKQAEDEFLELRGVHLATQNVGGFEEEAFELGEGDFFSVQNFILMKHSW
jgi:predicted naringenin-chalcone synthase